VASANVKLRAANAKDLAGEMPMAWQIAGYTNKEIVEKRIAGMKIDGY